MVAGGFRCGRVIGETDPTAGHSTGTPYTPANVLSCLYRHLGIDPTTTIPLDDAEPVRELLG